MVARSQATGTFTAGGSSSLWSPSWTSHEHKNHQALLLGVCWNHLFISWYLMTCWLHLQFQSRLDRDEHCLSEGVLHGFMVSPCVDPFSSGTSPAIPATLDLATLALCLVRDLRYTDTATMKTRRSHKNRSSSTIWTDLCSPFSMTRSWIEAFSNH